MRRLKVLLLFDSPYFTPRGYNFKKEFDDLDWGTEDDVYNALVENRHQVSLLGLYNDIGVLLEEIKENRPDVIFNLADVFHQKPYLDKNIAGLLQMLDIPYTGATPNSLFLCGDKALTKKILTYHKIKVPKFYTFTCNHKVWLPKKLNLPLIVKPLREEASRGISQASVVDSEEALIERVKFIHERIKDDAIVEEYIEGREFYVSLLGNRRIQVFPLREMKFGNFDSDEPRIATYKAKWDYDYRQKWDIRNEFAGRLANGLAEKVQETCKRAYRVLNMNAYARFDIRITPDSKIYILEANANPCLDAYDELGQSAQKAGISYNKLIDKILKLALDKVKTVKK